MLAAKADISSFLEEIPNGRARALRAMRFSDDPIIQQFIAAYDKLPSTDRDRIPLEAIAIYANVNEIHLLGSILISMRQDSVARVKIISVAGHPDMMKKRLEFAMQKDGYRDRDAIDTMLGALPAVKGTTIIDKVFNIGSPEPKKVDAEAVQEAEVVNDLDYIFPDSERTQAIVQTARKQLADGA